MFGNQNRREFNEKAKLVVARFLPPLPFSQVLHAPLPSLSQLQKTALLSGLRSFTTSSLNASRSYYDLYDGASGVLHAILSGENADMNEQSSAIELAKIFSKKIFNLWNPYVALMNKMTGLDDNERSFLQNCHNILKAEARRQNELLITVLSEHLENREYSYSASKKQTIEELSKYPQHEVQQTESGYQEMLNF